MRANLLRAVSHDLRTPLTSIYGACSTVIDNYDSLGREQKIKLLSEACADAQWLNRMVENLLSVTRIDADASPSRRRPPCWKSWWIRCWCGSRSSTPRTGGSKTSG